MKAIPIIYKTNEILSFGLFGLRHAIDRVEVLWPIQRISVMSNRTVYVKHFSWAGLVL